MAQKILPNQFDFRGTGVTSAIRLPALQGSQCWFKKAGKCSTSLAMRSAFWTLRLVR